MARNEGKEGHRQKTQLDLERKREGGGVRGRRSEGKEERRQKTQRERESEE